MTETPIIRLRTGRDVLATIPRLLGYQPRKSIVTLNQHEGGMTSTLRVDLPDAGEATPEYLNALIGHIAKVPGVHTMIVVLYTDEPLDADRAVPREDFVIDLSTRLTNAGYTVHDVLCVGPNGWTGYFGPDARRVGILPELDRPAEGDTIQAPVTDLVEHRTTIRPADEATRELFRAAFDAELIHRRAAPTVARTATELAEDAVHPEAGQAERARVAAAMTHPDQRDQVLYAWAWGPAAADALAEAGRRIEEGRADVDDQHVLNLVGLGDAPAPDRARVADAIAATRQIVAEIPAEWRHAPLTVLAWLHWSQGQGSIAGRFLDQALDTEADYGLANLLTDLLNRGHLPNWAYRAPEQ